MPRPRRQRARARVRGLAPRPVGPPSTVGRPPVAASSSGEGRQRHPRLALVAAEDRRRQPRRVATFPAVGRRSPAPEPRTPPPLLLRAVGVLSRCAAAVAPAVARSRTRRYADTPRVLSASQRPLAGPGRHNEERPPRTFSSSWGGRLVGWRSGAMLVHLHHVEDDRLPGRRVAAGRGLRSAHGPIATDQRGTIFPLVFWVATSLKPTSSSSASAAHRSSPIVCRITP